MKYRKARFPIVTKAYLRVSIGILLIVGSLTLFFLHFQLSIEFTGGVEIETNKIDNTEQLKQSLEQALENSDYDHSDIHVYAKSTTTEILATVDKQSDQDAKKISDLLQKTLISKGFINGEQDISGISLNGPSMSQHMKSTALWAVILGVFFVVIYMFFSFAPIRKVIPPKILTFVTVTTMIFDISVAAGGYGIFMMLVPTAQVDSIFIIVLLTVMGYSINDTIIILNRIRENTKKHLTSLKKGNINYSEVFEKSLWQVMRRSIGTSVSTFLVVAAMYIFGTDTLQRFSYTMAIGIICGTYSSIFLAAPLSYLLLNKKKK